MHRQDAARPFRYPSLDQRRIHEKGIRLHIDEDRECTGCPDGSNGRNGGVGNGDHLVPCPYVEGFQGQEQGVGTGVHADAQGCSTEGGKIPLKRLDPAPEDQPAGGKDLVRYPEDLLPVPPVLREIVPVSHCFLCRFLIAINAHAVCNLSPCHGQGALSGPPCSSEKKNPCRSGSCPRYPLSSAGNGLPGAPVSPLH